MNEEIQTQYCRGMRHNLLLGASVSALLALTAQQADAADTFLTSSNAPPLWIELGGDIEDITPHTNQWMPPAINILSGSGAAIRKDPVFSIGMEGRISYHLENSDWLVWASARYGRSQRDQSFHTQTNQYSAKLFARAYSDTTRHTENHMVLDFQAGKDIGMGLFGHTARSVLGAGVRFAQFSANGDDFVSSKPQYSGVFSQRLFFRTADIERRTSAIGPALSWDTSAPIISLHDSTVNIDWMALGAMLFGRQKVTGDFKTVSFYHRYSNTQHTVASHIARSRSVVIPNIDVMAGISYRLPAAKIAVGYRADIYFNAIDGGVDHVRSITRGFYGPFANISVGIGG